MISIPTLIDWLIPHIQLAGRYALQIQSVAAVLDPKSQFDNAFAQALTAADVSVQTFVEVTLLSQFPELQFFGEEKDKSYNMEYFLKETPLAVLLDPIDGTRYYMDGHRDFNIILSALDASGYRGAIIEMPAYGQTYIADVERGAFVEEKGVRRPLELSAGSKNVVSFQSEKYLNVNLTAPYNIIDVSLDYRSNSPCLSTNSILNGRAAAIVATNCSLIDWGVFGFMIERAGGVVTDFAGDPVIFPWQEPEFKIPEILISINPAVHEVLLGALEPLR